MIIIDFDDTLFDTQRLKHTRADALFTLGVPADLYWETYNEARRNVDGDYVYSSQRQAQLLSEHGFDIQQILNALETTTSHTSLCSFLLPFAESLLQYLQSLGQPIVLLSTGDPDFQTIKIKGSGISQYFERLILVNGSKEEALRTLFEKYDEDSTWFINDKVGETLELQSMFPKMHIVLKKSPKILLEEYIQSGLPYFEKLDEIKQYVQRFA
ncbi:MAG: HAD hydrolase-like protein [bacterium]|nr:HAD hydrolase-like protein [bacterium]